MLVEQLIAYVYLKRIGDRCNTSRIDNLQRRLKQLQPCTLIETLQTERSHELEYELHKGNQSKRLQQTEYFRLTKHQVEDVSQAIGWIKPEKKARLMAELMCFIAGILFQMTAVAGTCAMWPDPPNGIDMESIKTRRH